MSICSRYIPPEIAQLCSSEHLICSDADQIGLSALTAPTTVPRESFGVDIRLSLDPTMACQTLRRPLKSLSRGAQNPSMIPDFLLPAFAHPRQRNFSTSPKSSSRVGKAPVSIPPEVSLRFFDLPKVNTRSRNVNTPRTAVEVTGPQGTYTSSSLSAVIDLVARTNDLTPPALHNHQPRRS